MKYLFCSDGSESSYSALDAALSLAKKGAVVDVLCVINSKNSLTKLNKDEFWDEKTEKIFKKSEEIIKKHAHILGEFVVEHGDVYNIIEHAQKNFYNMLIFGSHGYKGLQNKFFGFARKVVEKSISSVFIYHPSEQKKKLIGQKVLVCVDDSYATLNAVISFMKNFNIKNGISLLTVESQISSHTLEICFNDAEMEEFRSKEIDLLSRNMSEIENILCHNKINVKSKIHLRGNPSEEILNFVKQDFDLIVLGSHAKEGLIDFLFGSVSKNIVDYIQVPILVVPTKAS